MTTTPRTYPADQCPPWLDTVIADWIGWASVDASQPFDIVDVASEALEGIAECTRTVILEDREETEQTCDTMAALAELAEHLRLLGLGGNAKAVKLCGLLLSKLEADLDWLDSRDAAAAVSTTLARVGSMPRNWAAVDPSALWSAVWAVAA